MTDMGGQATNISPALLLIAGPDSANEAEQLRDLLASRQLKCHIHFDESEPWPGATERKQLSEGHPDEKAYPLILILCSKSGLPIGHYKERYPCSLFCAVVEIDPSDEDSSIISELLLSDIQEIFFRPFEPDLFLERINKLWLRQNQGLWQQLIEQKRREHLEQQIEWLRRTKLGTARDAHSRLERDRALYYNLRTSISQGAGVGMLISLFDIANEEAIREGKYISIPGELFELLLQNGRQARAIIEQLNEIEKVYHNTWPLEELNLYSLYTLIREVIEELQPQSRIQDNPIVYSRPAPASSELLLHYNPQLMRRALREALLNAMRFARPTTPVMIYLDLSSSTEEPIISLHVLNFASPDAAGNEGIPIELEEEVFEPFHRLQPTLFERYKTLDMGVGMTMLRRIAELQNAGITISNIFQNEDPIRGERETLVELRMQFRGRKAV